MRTAPRLLSVALSAAAMFAVTTPAQAIAPTVGPYVALGDSYTSGPFIPDWAGSPVGCARSTNNYPSVVARTLKPASFKDVSCGGATTENITAPQSVPLFGTNAPQVDALNDRVRVVTVGIGGNDAGLISEVIGCWTSNLTHAGLQGGAPCRDAQFTDGKDTLTPKIDAVGPKVAEALRAVKKKAVNAKVYVVGYPTVLPAEAHGQCKVPMGLSDGDVAYLAPLMRLLNRELAGAAKETGAEYVDTAASSTGHDACAPAGTRWVEPMTVTGQALFLHPNAAGMANTGRDVAKTIAG